MSSPREEESYSESHLESPEYRARLMRKLNCLIAVLEVACTKVRRSLSGPEPDVDRLMRIHKNLRETLEVCQRAKKALERREALPEGLPENLSGVIGADFIGRPERRAARNPELISEAEARKFRELGPIEADELEDVDFDDLARQLLG